MLLTARACGSRPAAPLGAQCPIQALFDAKPTTINMADFSVHDVAAVLKRYIRELPQPIFTARLQSLFFAALGTSRRARRGHEHGRGAKRRQAARSRRNLSKAPTTNDRAVPAVPPAHFAPSFPPALPNWARVDLADDTRRLACLQLLLMILPTVNRDLLQAVLSFLKKVRVQMPTLCCTLFAKSHLSFPRCSRR